MQAQPLNAADFSLIEDTLLKHGNDHSVLNPSELDGYFTALVSGPKHVEIEAWFPAIWGGQHPDWESPEEARQFFDLCVRTSTRWHANWLKNRTHLCRVASRPNTRATP